MQENSISARFLVENAVSGEGLRAEHGLSVWLETPHGNILWDTGQSSLCVENAQQLGVHIENASCIALSHGHYDHTGGLSAILTLNPNARVFGHPDVFRERYAGSPDCITIRSIGSPVMKEIVQAKCLALVMNNQPSEIIPGLFLTGEIPRTTRFEDTGGDFFLDMECAVRDPILDDQALYFHTSRGIVILLGCAHSGVINTMNHVANLTGADKIHAVLGGMHLLNASDVRLKETAQVFEKYNVRMIGPCHCTGERAKTFFRSLFPGRMIECATGKHLAFAH